MHIVLFSPIRYDYLHQRPQKLAEQFLARGAAVTFVQPTGIKDLRSERNPIRFALGSLLYHLAGMLSLKVRSGLLVRGRKDVHRHFTIVSLPVTVPINRFNSALLEAVNASVFRTFIRNEILRDEKEETVAIVQNPFWGSVIERHEFDKICYDCLDDISIFAGNASLERFSKYEQALLAASDVIVTTAAKLEARLRKRTSKPVHRIPNGVDYAWFCTRAETSGVPADLANVPRPIVGYVGSIAGWLDYELVTAVARHMPGVSFVFVGPAEHEGRVKQLERSQNVHWLGRKPYDNVPAYVRQFDVCSIPFVHGEIAQTTNPVKVFEYLALGKPVVSTPLDELRAYEREKIVLFGDSPAAFVEAVKNALAESSEDLKRRRRQIAAANSWRSRATEFIHLLDVKGAERA